MSNFIKCSNCDEEFKISTQRLNKNRKNYFCSKKCEGEYRKAICSTKISTKCSICNKKMELKKSEFERRNKSKEITCSTKCMGELRKIKYMGRKNPNTKYNLDDNFFKEIKTEEKAYILGWIASDGSIRKNGEISIVIKDTDKEILEKMRDIVCKEIFVVDKKREDGNRSSLRFCSKTMVKDVCKWLGIKPGKKFDKIKMPKISKSLKWHFIRGFFDGDGCVRKKIKGRHIDCTITTSSVFMRDSLEKFCNIKCSNNNKWKTISWYGDNAKKFLDKIYSFSTIFLERKHETYLSWK